MSKLRVIVEFDIAIEDLRDYDATTAQEAASNQSRWFEEGDMGVADLVESCNIGSLSVKFTGVADV